MRVGIIAPNYYPVESGNAVTVRRIERQLKQLGCEVQVSRGSRPSSCTPFTPTTAAVWPRRWPRRWRFPTW